MQEKVSIIVQVYVIVFCSSCEAAKVARNEELDGVFDKVNSKVKLYADVIVSAMLIEVIVPTFV